MKRLLVVTYHFPPDPSVGGLRWAALSKYLARLGWEVSVVSGGGRPNGQLPPGVRIESRARALTLNDIYNACARALRERRRRAAVDGAERDATEHARRLARADGRGLVTTLRAEAAALLEFPDLGRGWILRAATCARSLVRTFEPDVIVSSGPPHSAHVVARLATFGRSVRWVMDMRDPWAGSTHQHPNARTRTFRTIIPRLERTLFRAADGVITNTSELADLLTRSYPGTDISVVTNGVDLELLPPPTGDRLPGLALCSVGTLYLGRDLGPVLAALRQFLRANPEADTADSKLRIAGYVAGSHAARLQQQTAALGCHQHVELLGTMSRADALNLVARSRLAIVPAQDQDLQVPAKLYEMIGLGVPTLVIAGRESAAGREGRRLGAVVVEPDQTEPIVTLLEALWRGETPQPRATQDDVDYRTIAAQMHRLLSV